MLKYLVHLTNPLIFSDPGIGAIRAVFVDASAEDGLERRYDEAGSAVWSC